jgi:hypothetical protein
MNENGTKTDETPIEDFSNHEPGSDQEAEAYEADDEIHDPEFDALITYIEAIARRVVAEWRQATAAPPPEMEPPATNATAAPSATAEAAELEPEAAELEPEPAEPDPGTSEYDDQHGIPYFELYR